jgi:polar amino acid transport system ATP-binding protein
MPVKLQLIDVWKKFGENSVCKGIDLTVEKGQLVCLIGASGSGKSTILRCINLLEPIDDGQILLDGEEISAPELDPRLIRRRVGLVFQSFNLFPHMTALENVLLAPRRVLGKPVAEIRQEAEALFARFGLADRMMHFPDQLSGGQQQRVAIIRALAMAPEVMLLDEITSALDPELVGEVLEVVRRLKAEGMTMILATHEMAFAREAADRVCFLDQGRVVEEGPPDVMFQAPREPRTRAFLQRILLRL